jgi:hypothetical protein
MTANVTSPAFGGTPRAIAVHPTECRSVLTLAELSALSSVGGAKGLCLGLDQVDEVAECEIDVVEV